MADVVSSAVRSRMMSGIRGKDTKPEIVLRRGMHRRGFRFRLHGSHLPGKPDLIFPKYRAVLFAHGCFWHGHECRLFKWPKSREEFWRQKISGNKLRDEANVQRLRESGWRVLTVWECALKGPARIGAEVAIERAVNWLVSGSMRGEVRGTDE